MSFEDLLTDWGVVLNPVAGANDSWGKPTITFADAFETPCSIQVRQSRDVVGPYLGADVVITNKIFLPSTVPVTEADQFRAGRMNTNEVQSLTITGLPTGGTFILAWGVGQTVAIAWNANAAAVQAALVTVLGAGNVLITGTNPAFTITFTGTLAHAAQALVTLFTNSLTGGTTPSVATAEVTQGHAAVAGAGYRVLVVNPNRGHHIELGALEIRSSEIPGAPVTAQ